MASCGIIVQYLNDLGSKTVRNDWNPSGSGAVVIAAVKGSKVKSRAPAVCNGAMGNTSDVIEGDKVISNDGCRHWAVGCGQWAVSCGQLERASESLCFLSNF